MSQFKRILGALSSANPAAYFSMILIGLGPLFRLLDTIIYNLVYPFLPNRGPLPIPRCLFLVGTPRSGSTIVYQAFSYAIQSRCLTNWHSIFPNLASHIINYFDLSIHKMSGNSYYGHTASLSDVNEGNYFIDSLFVNNPEKVELRKRFAKMCRQIDHTGTYPIVLKNIRNYSNIEKLYQAVPELSIIRVFREPRYVIQSVLKTYYEIGTFHPVTVGMKEMGDPVLKAYTQFKEVSKTIDDQLFRIPEANQMVIGYESFCDYPFQSIEKVAVKFPGIEIKGGVSEYLAERIKLLNVDEVNTNDAKRIDDLLRS